MFYRSSLASLAFGFLFFFLLVSWHFTFCIRGVCAILYQMVKVLGVNRYSGRP